MKCSITFKNFEHTDALDQKIREKSDKLTKQLGNDMSITWTCWIEKNDHIAEAKVKNKNDLFIAKAESDNLYKTMDLVIDKLNNQIAHKH